MILAILQARCSSTRLPGKVLKPLLEEPMIIRQIERLRRSARIETLVVATSVDPSDDQLVEELERRGILVRRGSLDDVVSRFEGIVREFRPGTIVRLTADCPLADAGVIDHVIDQHLASGADYSSNTLHPTYPDGLDVETVDAAAFARLAALPLTQREREHVTLGIYSRPEEFMLHSVEQEPSHAGLRWTVDVPEDLEFVRAVYSHLYDEDPGFGQDEILDLLERSPELSRTDENLARNSGSAQQQGSIVSPETSRYARSIEQLARAERTIPLGAQTYSKSRGTFPPGIAPIYGDRADGCRIWDVDGHEYVDLVNALASVTLGYGDAEITAAVTDQLSRGVTISLTDPLEAVVAEKIVQLVPSAEMVRFGKNGSDATSAAVRVARGYTGRDHVITLGYHGWHDWTIASMDSRNLGVPAAVKELVHAIAFNDLDLVERELQANPTAAIVLEPMNVVFPAPGYLEGLRALADRYGAILVFDEMITGFRFAKGGAQEYFGVIPDLSTFGKGLANGYPISAIAGRRDLMMLLERVFFSGTFSGELLSLTAANVVLDRVRDTDVIDVLNANGATVRDRVQSVIDALGMQEVVSLSGHPTWMFLVWNSQLGQQVDLLKVLFMQEMSRNGVLMIATHNVSAALDAAAIDTIAEAYTHALTVIKRAIESGSASTFLDAEVTALAKTVR